MPTDFTKIRTQNIKNARGRTNQRKASANRKRVQKVTAKSNVTANSTDRLRARPAVDKHGRVTTATSQTGKNIIKAQKGNLNTRTKAITAQSNRISKIGGVIRAIGRGAVGRTGIGAVGVIGANILSQRKKTVAANKKRRGANPKTGRLRRNI